MGSESEGPKSVMTIDRFCRNAVGPPEWECEAMGSVVWVQCATSPECNNLSIAESTVTDTLVVSYTMGQHIINMHTKLH